PSPRDTALSTESAGVTPAIDGSAEPAQAATLLPAPAGPDTGTLPEAATKVAAQPDSIFRETAVRPGESLALIFKREGIPQRELANLLASKPLGARLKRIYPGHKLTFSLTADDRLLGMTYSPGPLETLVFNREDGGFIGEEIFREPERLTAHRHAVIDQSLFLASQKAGLDDALTMRLAQMFQWDIDFVLDIRKGDEFYVLFEELYLGDEFVGYGDILAAEFINQKQSYQAVLYRDANGQPGYFGPDGRNMRKAFLRAPVEFSRISSNFNLRRKHPLHNRTMPHRGIDYAAPTGTPILASGDGRVTAATRSSSNGNYVVLQHGEQFMTKYLHMSKFGRGIRAGSKVRQGQIIGYVGATGWATGPHLHYEFLVNGVHQNPRTVKLPDATPVPGNEKDRFATQVSPLLALLGNYKQQIQLALAR
ncbi:MAG: peptidoglycan DD-metalloendopeptidase family protein, partial [Pseudomonadales bacterium]|nr:peptidoglycan DD-metalloendopeptidase family protein [Pseudomonadales bacterium]